MKKIIILALAFLVAISAVAVKAAPEYVYDGTEVIVKGVIENADAGSPVAILIVNPDADGLERDISEIEAADSTEAYGEILEYIGITTLDDAGSFGADGYRINLKDTLQGGECAIYINYIGKNELERIGGFVHVNAAELNELVEDFNNEDADYEELFTEDNLNLLSSVGIELESYQKLQNKSSFNTFLKGYAPFEDTELSKTSNFVNSFNEAIALEELKESDDPAAVLSKYSGTETGKHWNIAMDEDSDFGKLPEDAQSEVLESVKESSFTCAKDIEDEFYLQTGFNTLLENCKQRADVDKFIKSYHEVFDLDISLYEDEELTEYDLRDIQNAFLEGIGSVKEVDDIKPLYEDALKALEDENDDDGKKGGSSLGNRGGSGSGGSSGSYVKPPVVEVTGDKSEEIKPLKFYDVAKTHWAYTYINDLYDRGIISGKSDTEFDPDGFITKEEFLKILVGALGLEAKISSCDFADVDADAWYTPYVCTAFDNGLIVGKPDGTLGIGDNLTRQDVAVLISRVIDAPSDSGSAFTDISDAAGYAVDAIGEVSEAGLVSGYGDGSFKPLNTITRAESCAILYKLLTYREGLN